MHLGDKTWREALSHVVCLSHPVLPLIFEYITSKKKINYLTSTLISPGLTGSGEDINV